MKYGSFHVFFPLNQPIDNSWWLVWNILCFPIHWEQSPQLTNIFSDGFCQPPPRLVLLGISVYPLISRYYPLLSPMNHYWLLTTIDTSYFDITRGYQQRTPQFPGDRLLAAAGHPPDLGAPWCWKSDLQNGVIYGIDVSQYSMDAYGVEHFTIFLWLNQLWMANFNSKLFVYQRVWYRYLSDFKFQIFEGKCW